MTETPDENLCTFCTMCCNGMLFGRLKVTTAERARLGDPSRFSPGPDPDSHWMQQPCAHLGARGMCQRYTARPGKCRAYTCLLADKVDAGQMDEPFARDIVTQAKAFQNRTIAACRAAIPADHWDDTISDAADAIHALLGAVKAGAQLDPNRQQEAIFHWNVCKHYMRLHFQGNYCETPDAVATNPPPPSFHRPASAPDHGRC